MSADQHHTCSCCAENLDGPPFSYGSPAPVGWKRRYALRRDSELTADQCMIKGQHFYVHGLIEIPVRDSEEMFSWGVWVSLSEPNFARMHDLWEDPEREQEPAYFGWLSTELPVYPESTLLLKTHVHTRAVGTRPLIKLEPTDHPLAVEQREGITVARVHELAALLMG
ncbi:hypothetical protein F4556_006312 [Kitasatospora gansuensis]|uniref:DUF2199 domain-containing protein n=1 Tax=Kitasatospora gansuensis TaxID=258050 RepID=A0A7W7SI37_9ACTN|nr:DUF2199 domain-containing protein [Kitasatospora gansuensis]MBB4950777.1 hypothetical protein [Kitasatospora gansuensis]